VENGEERENLEGKQQGIYAHGGEITTKPCNLSKQK
jgi:hypothetical protein